MGRNAFIIGGTGQIGRAVASRLLGEGWNVTLAGRSLACPPADLAARGARGVAMDRSEPGVLSRAVGEGADLLVDTVGYDAPDARQLVDLGDRVGQIVTISSASVYRDEAGRTLDEARANGFPQLPVPITEDQPVVAPGPATYSTRKVSMERDLLDHARVPVAVLRPCAIHGPHSRHPREWWFVKRLLDCRDAIPLAYGGQSRFQTTATANIAAVDTGPLRAERCGGARDRIPARGRLRRDGRGSLRVADAPCVGGMGAAFPGAGLLPLEPVRLCRRRPLDRPARAGHPAARRGDHLRIVSVGTIAISAMMLRYSSSQSLCTAPTITSTRPPGAPAILRLRASHAAKRMQPADHFASRFHGPQPLELGSPPKARRIGHAPARNQAPLSR